MRIAGDNSQRHRLNLRMIPQNFFMDAAMSPTLFISPNKKFWASSSNRTIIVSRRPNLSNVSTTIGKISFMEWMVCTPGGDSVANPDSVFFTKMTFVMSTTCLGVPS